MKTRIIPLLLLAALLLCSCSTPAAAALTPSPTPKQSAAPKEGGTVSEPEISLSDALASCDAYAYPQNDGVKYWLDTSDGLKLHCWMISSDPFHYEKIYTADLKHSEYSGSTLRVTSMLDDYGFPLRGLRELCFSFEKDAVIMTADIDETKLAGGAGDNILSGEYRFIPWKGSHTPPVSLAAQKPFGELVLPANGYASVSNGIICFWLDTSAGLRLHCWTVNDTPAYEDRVYTANPDKSSRHGDWISVSELLDPDGRPMPGLRALSFLFRENSVLMFVTMDPEPSEDGEYRLPNGQFLFTPYSGSYIPPLLDGTQPELSIYDGYTCMKGDDVLFWLESSGARINLTLHCFFSDGTLRYERVYHIDSEKAFFRNHELVVLDLFDREGNSVWQDAYDALSFSLGDGMVLMHVEQVDKPPEDASDLIPSGDYLFTSIGNSNSEAENDGFLFDSEELILAAQDYYERRTGYRPPLGEAEYEGNGLWLIHLYEIVEMDGVSHTATSAWYTVDEHGTGTDFFGNTVDFRN